jgi:hypothetical protein
MLISLAALPIQVNFVELGVVLPDQRFHRHSAGDDGELGAVPGRHVVEPVGELQRTRARLVSHDDRGIAGDISGHVLREEPRDGVIGAAGTVSHRKDNHLSFVKIGNGIGLGRDTCRDPWRDQEHDAERPNERLPHVFCRAARLFARPFSEKPLSGSYISKRP